MATIRKTLTVVGWVCALSLVGCGPSEKNGEVSTTSDNLMLQTRIDQLKLASDYIFSDERFETEAFNDDVSKLLNQWVTSKPRNVEWELDPLVASWPDEVRRAADPEAMEKLEFLPKDAQYLQQAAWATALAGWIEQQPQRIADFRYLTFPLIKALDPDELQQVRESDTPLTDLLHHRYPQLDARQARDLALTWQLFDWTVRNIQLEELASPPSDDEIQLFALSRSDFDLAAAMGVPGPGYTRLPDQVMKFGRGDAWQRGRVFLLMMRSLGLDAAWLGTRAPDADPATATPRLIVVAIGDSPFLFDPELGLPIPTAEADGIATLADARTNSRVLTGLDVADFELSGRNRKRIDFPLREINDAELVLMFDASPPALSKRMKLVEGSLTGDRRLQLTDRPTEKANRLRQLTGIETAVLWDVPVLSFLYRKSFEQAVRFQNPRVGQAFFEEQIYDMPCPIKKTLTFRNENETFNQIQYEFIRLRTARHRAITGSFESQSRDERPGAKRLLLTMRMSDEEIEALETDDRIRAAFGVEQAGPAALEANTTSVIKTSLRSVRVIAALWLGIAHYELGDPSSALEWFDQVETFDQQEAWVNLTQYSRGRAQESMLKYPEAIRIYQASRSPQQAGDAIRARLLQTIVDAPQAEQPESTDPVPNR